MIKLFKNKCPIVMAIREGMWNTLANRIGIMILMVTVPLSLFELFYK